MLDYKVISNGLLYVTLKPVRYLSNISRSVQLFENHKKKKNKTLESLTELVHFITTSKYSSKKYGTKHRNSYIKLEPNPISKHS